MVLGRRGLSAILLAVAGLVFYMVFLAVLATEPSAQTDGDDTGGEVSASQIGQPDEGCSNPELVETFTGTENRLTPEFQITGSTFRLTFDVVEVLDPNGFPTLEADVRDDTGQPIGQGFLTFEEDGSENILQGPGTFSLDIRAGDVRYEIAVEDCVGTDQNDSNQDGQNRSTAERSTPRNVMRNTIPKKRLPPTGGLPVGVAVTGSVLAGASLLGLGLIVRRGPRG